MSQDQDEKMVSVSDVFTRERHDGHEYPVQAHAAGLFCRIAGSWVLDEDPIFRTKPRSIQLTNEEKGKLIDALYRAVEK